MLFQKYLPWLLLLLLLLLATLLLHVETAVYYVTPDSNSTLNNYTNTLQHYVENRKRYFIFRTDLELHFQPGTHSLNKTFIIEEQMNLTLSGNNSVIECSNRQVGISFISVINFTMKNIGIVQCSMKVPGKCKEDDATIQNQNGALFIKYCCSVTIVNVSITINASSNGLVAISNKMVPNISNLVVHVKCQLSNFSLPETNGIVFYSEENSTINFNVSYNVSNYTYSLDNLCSKVSPQCALKVLLKQSNYNTHIRIYDTTFSNLHNVTVLNYSSKPYAVKNKILNNITFYNCNVSKNTGNSFLKMFSFIVVGHGYTFGSGFGCQNHYNMVNFIRCNFFDNSGFKSLLHILPINTLSSNTMVNISWCNIYCKTAVEIASEVKVLWQVSIYVKIKSSNISFNTNGSNLLSATNAIIKLSDTLTVKNNSYYYSIFMLHLCLLKFYGHIEVYGNQVRHIFKGKQGSYYLLNEGTKITIVHNTVFNVLSQSEVYNERYQQICYFHFYSKKGNLDNFIVENKKLSYQIIIMDNIYTAPIHVLNYSNVFLDNCSWLVETAFKTSKSSVVYSRVVNRTLKGISRRNIRIIPSSTCQCVNSTEYNCMSHELGAVYPGQTIRTKSMQ